MAVLNGDTAEVGSVSHPSMRERVRRLTETLESEDRKSLFENKLRYARSLALFLLVLSLAAAATAGAVAAAAR